MAKRAKPQIQVRGLPAGLIEELQPIVLGNFDVEWDLEDLQPCMAQGALKVFHLSAQDWNSIEQEIGRPVDENHREWIDYACSSFVFAVMNRGEIPSAKRYHKQLRHHTVALEKIVDKLQHALTFKIEDNRVATFEKVSTARQHVVAYAMTHWQDEIKGVFELAERLREFRELVQQEMPSMNKGRPSNYELHNFFHTLYRIAQSLKLETNISSRRSREKHTPKRPTIFERFAWCVLKALGDQKARILAAYELSAKQKQRAEELWDKWVTDKSDIIDDLMEARRQAETEKPRTKKWAKKPSN